MSGLSDWLVILLLAGLIFLLQRVNGTIVRMEQISRDIELIRTNELVHLNTKVDEIVREFSKLREFVLSKI